MPRAALFLVLLVAACTSTDGTGRYSATMEKDATATAGQPVPMDPTRPVAVQDCSKPIEAVGGNLSCR